MQIFLSTANSSCREVARSSREPPADSLLRIFRFAESKPGCTEGLAATIDTPRIYRHERLPSGPRWSDVQRLLTASRGYPCQRDKRVGEQIGLQ